MENLIMYIFVAAMMVMVPGVDFVLVTKNTISLGTKAGYFTTLGIVCGLSIWTLVAVLGLATIVAQSIFLFNVIKYLGAAYLLYLGIQSIRAKGNNLDLKIEKNDNENYKTCFMQGFLSDVLNPKTVLVYLTLMPQFINTNENIYTQLIILAGILMLAAAIWFLIVIHILDLIRNWFSRPTFQSVFNKMTGSLLVFLAVKIALAKQ